jgi:uncharacterized coiled-coil protein SlyX
MSSKETPDDGGAGILSGLLAPLRLPERALEALEGLVEAAGNLGPMRSELTRVRKQTEPLGELMPALERIRKQTDPLAKLLPALERIRKQTDPLGELLPALERLRKQTEPLAELLPALDRLEERLGTRLDSVHEVVVALESKDSFLNSTVADLNRELAAMHKTLNGLKDDVRSVTERMPDASRGPLEKARDVLSGGSASEKE